LVPDAEALPAIAANTCDSPARDRVCDNPSTSSNVPDVVESVATVS